jgi:seryl-tRNA synthetase
MLDIAWIREHRELLQRTADMKGVRVSIAELMEKDAHRRRLLADIEARRRESNRLSKRVGALIGGRGPAGAGVLVDAADDGGVVDLDVNVEVERAMQQVKNLAAELASLEAEFAVVKEEYRQLMLLVPNPVSLDTPEGESDADNVEVRRVGRLPEFDFVPRDHVELGRMLGLFDIPRGVRMAGSRNYVLKGDGCRLHQAVQQLAMDVLERRGFTPLDVPLIVRGEALEHTGFFPLGEEQTFTVGDRDSGGDGGRDGRRYEDWDGSGNGKANGSGYGNEGHYLVGTSEVSLVSYFSGEVVDLAEPIRLSAATPCFRKEVGSAGRDVHGLYRVHQFAKVEQVVLCANHSENDPGLSERLLQELLRNAEEVVQLLELPYRVVSVCIGDLSQKAHKQYDLETWMPSRGVYGETHSASNLLDFQARRANIRYRAEDGKLRYCHTLNGTAVATPRILIPLLENHQQEDGSVRIPQALRPYLNGVVEIRPES